MKKVRHDIGLQIAEGPNPEKGKLFCSAQRSGGENLRWGNLH